MKNLILVSLILQLVITINVINGYKFGDIIAFPRGCKNVAAYKHYAIYVGPESGVNVGQGVNDIFHRSGTLHAVTCKFGKLSETKKKSDIIVENYFDGIDGFTVGTDDEIKKRIMSANDNCVKYKAFANNCEHLATWVRYNEAHSIQTGTIVHYLFTRLEESKDKEKGTEILNNVNQAEDPTNACELTTF